MKTIYETLYDSFEDEMSFNDTLINLKSVQTEQPIIAIAQLGLWNGNKQGYRVCSRMLSDVLTVGSQDFNHLFYDGYNVRKSSVHHDGTNLILFREFRPNVDQDKFIDMVYSGKEIDNATLNRYTRSLRRYVKEIYGW